MKALMVLSLLMIAYYKVVLYEESMTCYWLTRLTFLGFCLLCWNTRRRFCWGLFRGQIWSD